MLQEHYSNAHSSRSMFAICFWSSVHCKYGPGAYLTLKFFQIINGPGQYGPGADPRAYGPDHKSRPNLKKATPTSTG